MVSVSSLEYNLKALIAEAGLSGICIKYTFFSHVPPLDAQISLDGVVPADFLLVSKCRTDAVVKLGREFLHMQCIIAITSMLKSFAHLLLYKVKNRMRP